jgi:putative transposase
MNRRKPEQIVKLLRKSVEDFCREEQISPATCYRWQRKYGGLQVDDAKRLKVLEVENAKLKRLLTESMLANDAIREFLEKRIIVVDQHALITHVESKGLSKRAAYRWTGISRSVSRYELQHPAQDAQAKKQCANLHTTIHAMATGESPS